MILSYVHPYGVLQSYYVNNLPNLSDLTAVNGIFKLKVFFLSNQNNSSNTVKYMMAIIIVIVKLLLLLLLLLLLFNNDVVIGSVLRPGTLIVGS